MALRLRELNPRTRYVYVITPTGDELPEMFTHWRTLQDRLATRLTVLQRPGGLKALIEENGALPNWRARWCTVELKIRPFASFLEQATAHYANVYSYVGIRADESEREGGDYASLPGVVSTFPLREWSWGLEDVLRYLDARGINIPQRTDCARCFFQSLQEWKDLWRNHPDLFEDACLDEDRTGHTYRSAGRDRWPASLRELSREFASNRTMQIRADLKKSLRCRVCRA